MALTLAQDIGEALVEKGWEPVAGKGLYDVPALIRALPSGGGGGIVSLDYQYRIDLNNPLVTWLYRDTTTGQWLIKEQRVSRGSGVTPPTDVGNVVATADNPALTFFGWNYSPAEYSNIQIDTCIGAVYTPTDNKTWLQIVVPTANFTFQIPLTLTGTATFELDKGDGTSPTQYSATITTNNLVYANAGIYWMTLRRVSGTGTFVFGTVFDGQGVRAVRRAFVGDGATTSGNFFSNCNGLVDMSLATNYVGSTSGYLFGNTTAVALTQTSALQLLIIPSGCTAFNGVGLIALKYVSYPKSCVSITNLCCEGVGIRRVCVPDTATTIGSGWGQKATSLTDILFPASVISIGGTAAIGSALDALNLRSLRNVICLRETPPTGGAASFGSYTITPFKVWVPDTALAAYKAATNWVTIADKIFPLSQYT